MLTMSLFSFSKQTCALAHQKLYQKDWDEAKQKGYDLRADAIEIKHAKASREIASEVSSFCLLWGFLLHKQIDCLNNPVFFFLIHANSCILSCTLFIGNGNMKMLLNLGAKVQEPIPCHFTPRYFWHSPQYE